MVGLQRLVVIEDARTGKANELEKENEERRVTCIVFLSPGPSCYLRPYFFLAFLFPYPTALSYFSRSIFRILATSLTLSNRSCLSRSLFSRLGSRDGKACIIRRNSTGINPRTNPIQPSRFCPSLSSN